VQQPRTGKKPPPLSALPASVFGPSSLEPGCAVLKISLRKPPAKHDPLTHLVEIILYLTVVDVIRDTGANF